MKIEIILKNENVLIGWLKESEVKGLPELKGTEKQIRWAQEIRKDFFIKLKYKYEKVLKPQVRKFYGDEKIPLMNKKFEELVDTFAQETSAKVWIEKYYNFHYMEFLKENLRGIFKNDEKGEKND